MINSQCLLGNTSFSTHIGNTLKSKYKFLVMLSVFAMALGALTPEHSSFERTHLPFAKEELAQHREKGREILGKALTRSPEALEKLMKAE